MGMCKGCKDVVSFIEIKQGLCKECQLIGTLEDIEQIKREKEEELTASKGKLLYEFHSEDHRIIASLLMGLAVYLTYYYYAHDGDSIPFLSISIFIIGLFFWGISVKSLLKIYSNVIEVEGMSVPRKKILKIEVDKNNSTIFTNEIEVILNLKPFAPDTKADVSTVLKNYMTDKEADTFLLNKEDILENSPLIEEDENGIKQVFVVMIVVIILVVAIKLFIQNS